MTDGETGQPNGAQELVTEKYDALYREQQTTSSKSRAVDVENIEVDDPNYERLYSKENMKKLRLYSINCTYQISKITTQHPSSSSLYTFLCTGLLLLNKNKRTWAVVMETIDVCRFPHKLNYASSQKFKGVSLRTLDFAWLFITHHCTQFENKLYLQPQQRTQYLPDFYFGFKVQAPLCCTSVLSRSEVVTTLDSYACDKSA